MSKIGLVLLRIVLVTSVCAYCVLAKTIKVKIQGEQGAAKEGRSRSRPGFKGRSDTQLPMVTQSFICT